VTTTIVLFGLAVGWTIFLSVWWRDSRRDSRFGDARGGFNPSVSARDVSRFVSSVGSAEFVPRSSFAAQRRRRQVLIGLAVAAVFFLFAFTIVGVVALVLHVVCLAALVIYGYAVIQRRNVSAEREIKVQMLHPDRVAPLHRERITVNA